MEVPRNNHPSRGQQSPTVEPTSWAGGVLGCPGMWESSPHEAGWARAIAVVLLALLGAGAVATAVAAAQYPGGTWMDRSAEGHSFWGNFLCDIARDPALDGRPHPGAAWGRCAEWALILALCLFFWIAPALVEPRRRRRTIRLLGAVATLGLALVPITSGVPHALALIAGAGPGFAATLLVLRGLRHLPVLAWLGALALGLSAVELVLFLGFHERFAATSVPLAVPAVQRLALLAAVAWMAGCAVAVLRAPAGDRPG
ncbi:MAG TPA: hypothetical protein VFD38_20080 [Myxococcaceae bacterium]|nr:hypothetical protein [Myxococcaceae bacterium]